MGYRVGLNRFSANRKSVNFSGPRDSAMVVHFFCEDYTRIEMGIDKNSDEKYIIVRQQVTENQSSGIRYIPFSFIFILKVI